jgi:hypothetical protein
LLINLKFAFMIEGWVKVVNLYQGHTCSLLSMVYIPQTIACMNRVHLSHFLILQSEFSIRHCLKSRISPAFRRQVFRTSPACGRQVFQIDRLILLWRNFFIFHRRNVIVLQG